MTKTKQKRKYHLFNMIFLFLLIYYPPIFRINTIHILAAIAYLFLIIRNKFRNVVYIIKCLMPLYMLFVFLLVVTVVNGSLSSVSGLFLLLFEVVPIVCAAYVSGRNYEIKEKIIDYLIIVGMIQAFFSIATYAIPSLHNSIIELYMTRGFKQVLQQISGFRAFGFSYTLTFAMPVVQSMIAGMCLFLGLRKSNRYLLCIPFLLFSSIINARVGIVVFIICAVGAIFSNLNKGFRLLARVMLIVTISILSIYIFNIITAGTLTNEWIQEGVNDILSIFGITEGSEYNYFNYLYLERVYTLPDTLGGVLFGTGNTAIRNHVSSDIGFINDIWLGGVLYCISIIAIIIKRTFFICKSLLPDDKTSFWLSISYAVALLAVNIKGQCFAWNEVMITWMLLYCVSCLDVYEMKFKKLYSNCSLIN